MAMSHVIKKKEKKKKILSAEDLCCCMHCLDGEVVFIHSKYVNKIVSSTPILFSHVGNLKITSGGYK